MTLDSEPQRKLLIELINEGIFPPGTTRSQAKGFFQHIYNPLMEKIEKADIKPLKTLKEVGKK